MATVVRRASKQPGGQAAPSTALRVSFAHPSEEEFAALLSFYGIAWLYEPTTFPLAWDGEGQVTQAFAPDFYLPEYDLYIELATRRQRQMTEKHRKIRRLHELYPQVQIKLVNRRAFEDLLRRFDLSERADRLVGDVGAQGGHV